MDSKKNEGKLSNTDHNFSVAQLYIFNKELCIWIV